MSTTLNLFASSDGRSWANMGGGGDMQPKFGALNGKLVTQQPIMTNVSVNLEMHQWRQKDAGDYTLPNEQIFNRLLSTGTSGDAYARFFPVVVVV